MRKIIAALMFLPIFVSAELVVVPIEDKDQRWEVAGLHLGDTFSSAREKLEADGYRCGQGRLELSKRGYYSATLTCRSLTPEGGDFPDPANTIELHVAFPIQEGVSTKEGQKVMSDHAPIYRIEYKSQFHPQGGKYYSAVQIEKALIDRYGQPLEDEQKHRWLFQNGDPSESLQLEKQAYDQQRQCKKLGRGTTKQIIEWIECERVRWVAHVSSAVKNVAEVRAGLLGEQFLEIELRRNGYQKAVEGIHGLAALDAEKAKLGEDEGPTAADF